MFTCLDRGGRGGSEKRTDYTSFTLGPLLYAFADLSRAAAAVSSIVNDDITAQLGVCEPNCLGTRVHCTQTFCAVKLLIIFRQCRVLLLLLLMLSFAT